MAVYGEVIRKNESSWTSVPEERMDISYGAGNGFGKYGDV